MSGPEAQAQDPLDQPTPAPPPTMAGDLMDQTPLPAVAGFTHPDYSGQPMIHLDGIHKAFGSRQILRGIDLAIYPGETVCLIGGSGTGKSVSLKHIMRLIDPDRGQVWLDGENITEAHGSRLQLARTKLGVNFQFGALLNWMTIFENVALPLRENTRMKDKEIEQRVMAKLELLSIPHARDLFPTEISGGMAKRAGLARAVVMEESLKVILYDEPTSGLDPISTAVVDEMINDMKKRLGLTQVIVTHDMTSAYRTADRIAVLHQGRVAQFGTPHEIQHSKVPYVQQFVLGLSTSEALEVNKKSGRLRKSGIIQALSKSDAGDAGDEGSVEAPRLGPKDLGPADLAEPIPTASDGVDDYSDLGDIAGLEGPSEEGETLPSDRLPSAEDPDAPILRRGTERASRSFNSRRVAALSKEPPSAGQSANWLAESQDDLSTDANRDDLSTDANRDDAGQPATPGAPNAPDAPDLQGEQL